MIKSLLTAGSFSALFVALIVCAEPRYVVPDDADRTHPLGGAGEIIAPDYRNKEDTLSLDDKIVQQWLREGIPTVDLDDDERKNTSSEP